MEEKTTAAAEAVQTEERPERRTSWEWDVDVGEIMDGVRDEAESPEQAVTTQPEDGELFTLKHLDEVSTVSREKVIELAQKGLDYDRVRAKLDAARDELGELKSLAEKEGLDMQAFSERSAQTRAGESRARREAREFFEAHPEAASAMLRDRQAIPDEVWQRVRAGESLNAAWESVELRRRAQESGERVKSLERELAETRQEWSNAARSTGSVVSAGGDVERDMAAIGWNEV